ncbi:protein PBDC1-like [Lineus longissimus]|uniref:protein PBDC1-like n=1 Tax=Lineus longissimus TaxID=88925 RepID=UPI002B4D19C5
MSISTNAEDYGNNESLELVWAEKTFKHAEVYFNLLCAVQDPKFMRLTASDDAIYNKFREEFKDFEVGNIVEDTLKRSEAKAKWRNFCDQFKNVPDFNFGTLLRLDSEGEYNEKNTTIAPRIQFLAIELARNREGYNMGLGKKYKPSPAEETI